MKIRPIVYIVPLAVLALALAIGSALLLRVFFLLSVLGVVAFLWTAFGLKGLRAEAGEMPEFCYAGDSFEHDVTLSNDSLMPKLLVKAEEKTDLPGYSNMSVLNIRGLQTTSLHGKVTPRRRGRYSMGSVSITTGDPFGLFTRTKVFGKPKNILVYPQIADLPFYRTTFSSLTDYGYGTSGRRISQISPSASSVREMVSGDSQEHIHWRSTAHTGKLMVKVFDAEHSSDNTKDVSIVLDMQKDAQYGEGDELTEEYLVSAAASIAKKCLDDGMKVGLLAEAERGYYYSPNGSSANWLKMLDSLALMKATGTVPVEEVMGDVGRFPENSTVIVVTTQCTESVANSLRHLRNYGNSVVAVFVDSSTFGGTLNPTYMSHALGSTGAQVYVIRAGDNMSKALDSRAAIWYSRYL